MLKLVNEHPMFKERFSSASIVGNVKGWNLPLGSIHKKPYGEGFVLVGDAASLIDPFSGEGIGNAMTSGKLAAATIHKALEANDFSAKMLEEYDKNLWALLGYELRNSEKMQKRGKTQWLVNLVLRKAQKNKELRGYIGSSLVDQHARQGFGSPMFYVRMLLTPPIF
jgi:flavin-dependent dehydrogenase